MPTHQSALASIAADIRRGALVGLVGGILVSGLVLWSGHGGGEAQESAVLAVAYYMRPIGYYVANNLGFGMAADQWSLYLAIAPTANLVPIGALAGALIGGLRTLARRDRHTAA